MQDARYVYASARVRVLERHLLKKAVIVNLLDAGTLHAASRVLSETEHYKLYSLDIKDSSGLSNFMDDERKKLEGLARELFVEDELFEAFTALRSDVAKSYSLVMTAHSVFLEDFVRRFIDIYNMKTFLRMRFQGLDPGRINQNLIDGGYMPKSDFIRSMGRTGTGSYGEILRQAIARAEREGDFSSFERQAEDYLISILKPAKYMYFGPEALFGYCFALEAELRNLKIILLGKMHGVSREMIQERLSQPYV